MSQQTIRQQARRAAREMAEKRRKESGERERRVIDLSERVMVAIGERNAAVAEKRAGEARGELTWRDGLSSGEALERCGETVTLREATRLRWLAGERHAAAGRDRSRVETARWRALMLERGSGCPFVRWATQGPAR